MQDVSKGEGRTVLFVSHNMESIQNLCTKGILLDNGSIVKSGGIEDVVNYYILGNLESVQDISIIDEMNKYRISATTKEVEFKYLERINNYKTDVLDDLVFRIGLKRNTKVDKVQIMALIDDVANGGNRVGLSFSKEITLTNSKADFEIEFTIKNHNLTKGKYIMDFWVGIGDVTSTVKYYDAVYDTLTFEVVTFNQKFINEWHSYWGHNCYGAVNAVLND